MKEKIKISNMLLITLLATLLLSVFISHNSYALGKTGHKVVCKIAYEHLNNDTRLAVNHLLTYLPKTHKKRINSYHHRRANAAVTYIDSCSWADAIKRDKSYIKFKPWHYISVPRNATHVTPQSCTKNCITTAIKFHKNVLATEHPSWKKLQALMFLNHWIGDIHQPMHVNFASDRGGNKVLVDYKVNNCKNMHWLWDECLLYPAAKVKNKHIFYQQTYNNVIELKNDVLIKKWQKDSVYDWATESLLIARLPSVKYCSIEKNDFCAPYKQKKIVLNKSYQKQHKKILERRILQAGVRLAHTLNESLK